MSTAEWVTALLSGGALAISLVALFATRQFAKRDFRRDRAFEIASKYHRTALSLQGGDGRTGEASNDRVEHLRRTELQLQALGYKTLANAFKTVHNQDWSGEPTEGARKTVDDLTDVIEDEFGRG